MSAESVSHHSSFSSPSPPSEYQHSSGSDISKYDDIASMPLPRDANGQCLSYTNLVVDSAGWHCPNCVFRGGQQMRWAGLLRGYAYIPSHYTRYIADCYGKEPEKELHFRNPYAAKVCMNAWNFGLQGTSCEFSREVVEGDRSEELEGANKEIFGNTGHIYGAMPCAACCFHSWVVNGNEKLKVFIMNEKNDLDNSDAYMEYESNPWFDKHPVLGGHTMCRHFVYDGTLESMKCKTKKFGAGLNEGSENTACTGHYGGPVTFWQPQEKDDKVTWYEMDWFPDGKDEPPRLEIMTEEQFRELYSDSSSSGDYGGSIAGDVPYSSS